MLAGIAIEDQVAMVRAIRDAQSPEELPGRFAVDEDGPPLTTTSLTNL